ncbi:MAG: glycosyltransferase [Nanoarchaeota archaeon]
MANPLVSMIIAAYNEEKHVGKCLTSLSNQSYKPIEIILVDDGSSDRTVEIAREIAKKNKSIKVIEQGRRGMAQGWNNAFKRSKGKVICLFGADMIAGKDFIRKMIQPILKRRALGTQPVEAKIVNIDNLWARAKGKSNRYADTTYLMLTRDLWIKAGGADERKGYSADQSFYNFIQINPTKVSAELYDHNPESWKHTWRHAKWYGTSMPAHRAVFFLLFPILAIGKSILHFAKDPYPRFIYFLPWYYCMKYLAFLAGFFSHHIFGEDVSKRN